MSEAHKIYPLTVECFILPWVLEGDFSCLLFPPTLGGSWRDGSTKGETEDVRRRRRKLFLAVQRSAAAELPPLL